MKRTGCLTVAKLQAFQFGDMPEQELDAAAAHMDECAQCEAAARALDTLATDDMASLRDTARAQQGLLQTALPQPVDGHEILEEIGRGGMGVVYKARHVRLNRIVALKMLLAEMFADRETYARFQAEATAVARLHHPNIVDLYEVGEQRDSAGLRRPYFTLEFVDGGNLSQRLAGRPQPPDQAAAWLESLARAVHYAHTQGVVHRDLKPSNVLVTRYGDLKVCDFGVAKYLEGAGPHTCSGMIVGTAEYMAPEQACGATVGPATDVHGLGAVLYTMLTGRPPYQAASVLETLQRLQNEEPIGPSRLQRGIPRDLDTICMKCLHKEPARRYASAEALAEDVRRFRMGEPVRARPVRNWERAAKWVRRRPAVATLLAALMLVTLAGLGLVTWQWQEAIYQRGLADLRAEGESDARRLAQQREQDEIHARHAAERLLAAAVLDQGLALCDQGEVGPGLLWLARSLELATQAQDLALERVARINLAAWRQARLFRPTARLSHPLWAWTVAFSPDGKRAATGSQDRTARLWDAENGQPRSDPLPHRHPVWLLAFSPDGLILLTGSGSEDGEKSEFRLWDVATGKPLTSPIAGHGLPCAGDFAKDGRTFFTADASAVRLWKTAGCVPLGSPLPHPGAILTAAFSPDGGTVLTCGEDGTARRWDAVTGTPQGAPLRHVGPVEEAVFSPDGQTLATSATLAVQGAGKASVPNDGQVYLWRWATGTPLGEPLACGGRVRALAFSPDGRALAAGGTLLRKTVNKDATPAVLGQVHLWRPAGNTGAVNAGWRSAMAPLEHSRTVRAVAFSPDSRLLLTGAVDCRARFFAAGTGTLLHESALLDGPVIHAAFRPDGRAALTGAAGGNPTQSARMWRVPGGRGGRKIGGHQGSVDVVRFAPRGRVFLSAGADGLAQLWDAASSQPFAPAMHHAASVRAAAFSADGTMLVTGSDDKTARLWDVATGQPRGEPLAHPGPVRCVAWSRDGKLLVTGAGAADYKVRVWDTGTGHCVGPPLPCSGEPTVVAFSPDRRLILAASHFGITCWRTDNRQPVPGFSMQPPRVKIPAAFSPDGRIFAGVDAATIRILDATGARPLQQWPSPEQLGMIQLSPDGNTLLLQFLGHAAQLWDVARPQPKTPPLFHRGGLIRDMTFSPDGRTVLIGCHDRTAWLWDVVTGKMLGPPLPHSGPVTSVSIAADGRDLVVGCADGTIVLWPMPQEEAGAPQMVRRRIEAQTGLFLDGRGILQHASQIAVRDQEPASGELWQ